MIMHTCFVICILRHQCALPHNIRYLQKLWILPSNYPIMLAYSVFIVVFRHGWKRSNIEVNDIICSINCHDYAHLFRDLYSEVRIFMNCYCFHPDCPTHVQGKLTGEEYDEFVSLMRALKSKRFSFKRVCFFSSLET
ncbi:hypothetical protein KSP39_PZI000080 [Platanthera zijinensis]|uniref:Uncharacterized protein n=1 Tax=Platanthera zijinensis TaxID=2320716 RepID=A0AAP0GFQ3_9ASPA